MVDLSIAVLHFNRWDLTKECMASIEDQDIPCSHEKIILDNGSVTPLPWEGVPNGWRTVQYEENKGHIVGQNRCFEAAQGEYVLFVANDVRFVSHTTIEDFWKSRNYPWVQCPVLMRPDGFVDNHGLTWEWPGYGLSVKDSFSTYRHQVDAFTGSCYFMRKDIWALLGGFDEHLESSHEDIDFSLKMAQLNIQTYPNYAVRAIHLGNATLKHQPSHTRAAFHRDRVYVVKKHYVGLDRLLRLGAVTVLDTLRGILPR